MSSEKYLRLLAHSYPNQQAVFTEIINLQAILNLPKGTEHFMSDLHGEYEAFLHILNNCSGVVREHIEEVFAGRMSHAEMSELCTLIYYPKEKLAKVQAEGAATDTWYKDRLDELITLARALSSRYTRSKVRKAIPHDYAYIIDELLHTHPDENNYRVRYHERIIESILETGATQDFIVSLSALIKRLVIDHLHLVGDIYDRGAGAAHIMDALMSYHSLDIQWGNHDILWIGAAAGSPACIMTVLRNNLRYNNFSILENDYGISLRPLMSFAKSAYTDESDVNSQLTPLLKCVNVLLFKLEAQVIQAHPEFGMNGRLLLDKISGVNRDAEITLADGKTYPLITSNFPTLDASHPFELTPDEQAVVNGLVHQFTHAKTLQTHMDFLVQKGSMYKVVNNNVLFHGCLPMNSDGTFAAIDCEGERLSGRAYLDFCDHMVRYAWAERHTRALDWMYYLWIGFRSPVSGRYVKTFERSYIADTSTWSEPMDPYFDLTSNQTTANDVMRAFNVDPEIGHIINGHTPVKTAQGEKPLRAHNKILVIDGGFCSAYHPKTGIAGYTLIYSSRGMRLKAHEAFSSVEAALEQNADIASTTNLFEPATERIMVAETDTGATIRAQIEDLRELLQAYRTGMIQETHPL